MYKKIIKNFFIYSGGAMLVKALSALSIPFTLAFLSTTEYGLLSIVNNFTNILSILIGFGLRQVFWIEYFHCEKNQIKKMINDLIFLYLIIDIPIFFFLLANIKIINKYIFFNFADPSLIICTLAIVFFSFFNEFFYQALKYQQSARLYTILQITNSVISILLSFFLIVYFKLSVLGVVVANLIGILPIIFIGFYLYLKKNCHNKFSFPETNQMKNYLKTGLTFIPSMIFAWLMSSSDRFILAKLSSLSDVGIYSLADSFGQLYYLIILQPLSGSYLPDLYEQFANNKNNILDVEKYNKKIMFYSMLIMFVLITGGYGIVKFFLKYILPPKYCSVTDYIWFILVGYIFLMGTYFTTAIIQFKKHKLFLAISFCLPAIINVILNFILIPYFKIYGCIISTLISYVAYFLITFFYNLYILKNYESMHFKKADISF
ncbi:oligosaccharide flippase family protein [Candidatus Dependentiae bacterium]|nr:oligosaccharide flippase family protein [Candidatus Dependentiae bacterium]